MIVSNFEKYLVEFNEELKHFQGKKKMNKYVLDRLEKSYLTYAKEINNIYGSALDSHPRITLNKIGRKEN